jgi:hypothetical protein
MKKESNYYVQVSSKWPRGTGDKKLEKFNEFVTLEACDSIKKSKKLIKDFLDEVKKVEDPYFYCCRFRIMKREETHTLIETVKPIYPFGKRIELVK